MPEVWNRLVKKIGLSRSFNQNSVNSGNVCHFNSHSVGTSDATLNLIEWGKYGRKITCFLKKKNFTTFGRYPLTVWTIIKVSCLMIHLSQLLICSSKVVWSEKGDSFRKLQPLSSLSQARFHLKTARECLLRNIKSNRTGFEEALSNLLIYKKNPLVYITYLFTSVQFPHHVFHVEKSLSKVLSSSSNGRIYWEGDIVPDFQFLVFDRFWFTMTVIYSEVWICSTKTWFHLVGLNRHENMESVVTNYIKQNYGRFPLL